MTGLIDRRDGNIEASLELFKQAHQLNKQSAAVTKQVARSLYAQYSTLYDYGFTVMFMGCLDFC